MNRIKRFDSIDEVAAVKAQNNPHWQKLVAVDGRDDPGKCAVIYAKLSKAVGETALHRMLLSNWAAFDEMLKINICYAASLASAMSTVTAISLFSHPASGTHERHLLAAGLAATAKARQIQHLIPPLLDVIGAYPDACRQSILDRFIKNARHACKEIKETELAMA